MDVMEAWRPGLTRPDDRDPVPVVAPRDGMLTARLLDNPEVPHWFDASKALRFPAGQFSPDFGQAVYFTRKTGRWFLYRPPGLLSAAPALEVFEITREDALAFLLREEFDVPPELRATKAAQEV